MNITKVTSANEALQNRNGLRSHSTAPAQGPTVPSSVPPTIYELSQGLRRRVFEGLWKHVKGETSPYSTAPMAREKTRQGQMAQELRVGNSSGED